MNSVLHVVLHAMPSGAIERRVELLGDHPVEVLEMDPARLDRPLPVDFDQVLARLEQLPRLFIEPDGSFLWIGPQGPAEWQIDGQLNDSARGLMTIELKLSGDSPDLCALLHCLDWPAHPVAFQLVREGRYVDEHGLSTWLTLECPARRDP